MISAQVVGGQAADAFWSSFRLVQVRMTSVCNFFLQKLQVRIRLVSFRAQGCDYSRLPELKYSLVERRMQRDIGENFPRAIEIRARCGQRQNRVVIRRR